MSTSITIIDTTIPIIEYLGQRVITLAYIDKIHRRPEGTAKRNFGENKERFIEGKHYYLIDFAKKNEFRSFELEIPPRGLTVLTERDYSMLVKSFTDDFAWEVQEQLVDGYFDTRAPMSTAEFLVQQANIMLEHEQKIKALENKQIETDVRIAETRQDVRNLRTKAEDAFEAASAALRHKFGEADHFTIIAFCSIHGIQISAVEAKGRGIQASKMSAAMDKAVIKIPDERWGKVGSYHKSVLERVFKDKISNPQT